MSQSLLKQLDTLKLHLLRMTLRKNSKHTILIILLNWTSQFNLAILLPFCHFNTKTSRNPLFMLPIALDFCDSFSKIPCDLWSTQAKSSATAKATVKGAGLGWLQHCCDVAYLQDQELSCLISTLFIPPFFVQHCWRSNRDCYKLVSGSWYATWKITHTHTYVWALWVGTKAQAQNCFVCITKFKDKKKKMAVVTFKKTLDST